MTGRTNRQTEIMTGRTNRQTEILTGRTNRQTEIMTGRTNRQTKITALYMFIDSSLGTQRCQNVTSAVYPHLKDFTGKLNFRYQAKHIPLDLPSSPFEAKRFIGS